MLYPLSLERLLLDLNFLKSKSDRRIILGKLTDFHIMESREVAFEFRRDPEYACTKSNNGPLTFIIRLARKRSLVFEMFGLDEGSLERIAGRILYCSIYPSSPTTLLSR